MLRARALAKPTSHTAPAPRVQLATPLRPAAVLARGLAGPAKIHVVNQEDLSLSGPASVDREEGIIEMGVAYAPGVPSPMEGATTTFEPIVVDGLVVKTGGDQDGQNKGLGAPVQYIKLSPW